ncbi:MAG: class I SAM-dependent methyltransferase [Anaerolineales bacterium]|nr:class I SAM-dependent methyltransferase [Anaerolineales bacterium]
MPKAIYTEIALPEIVIQANALAVRLGFPLMPEGRPVGHKGPPSACIPQVGKLLQVLASGKPKGRIGEQGTGAGVGTAWLASGLRNDARLISVEINPTLATAVTELFKDYPNVEIKIGDCNEVMSPDQPYDLLFVDAMPRGKLLDPSNWDSLVDLIKIGGQIVMDDLTPVEQWLPEWNDIVDAKREFAFTNHRVAGVEVRTTQTTSALIITRIK